MSGSGSGVSRRRKLNQKISATIAALAGEAIYIKDTFEPGERGVQLADDVGVINAQSN